MSRSAEPMRKAPYSSDLRWRIVWQKLALNLNYQQISEKLCISIGTVHNILKLFESTGEVEPRKYPNWERKLDNHHLAYIIRLIVAYPTLHLSDITEKFEKISGTIVSTSTLCRLLASHGFTCKKIQHVALYVDTSGPSFMATILLFRREMLVWLNETGSNLKDLLRQYGYALCGERAVSRKMLVRGQRTSTTAAICTEGMLASSMTTGTVNGEYFTTSFVVIWFQNYYLLMDAIPN